jgi:hypothetical protein
MLVDLYRLLAPEGVKILLVLFPSLVTGLEREERKTDTDRYSLGGVRTFPLIGSSATACFCWRSARSYPLFWFCRSWEGFLMLF